MTMRAAFSAVMARSFASSETRDEFIPRISSNACVGLASCVLISSAAWCIFPSLLWSSHHEPPGFCRPAAFSFPPLDRRRHGRGACRRRWAGGDGSQKGPVRHRMNHECRRDGEVSKHLRKPRFPHHSTAFHPSFQKLFCVLIMHRCVPRRSQSRQSDQACAHRRSAT